MNRKGSIMKNLWLVTAFLAGVWIVSGCGQRGPGPGESPGTVESEAAGPAATGVAEEKPTAGSGGAEGEEAQELLVLCGTSFGPPVQKLAALFQEETGIASALSFGGSEDLLPQIKLGQVGDVFVTHDPYMEYTEDAGAMLRWIHVGYVAPVLVVQKGNPKGLTGIEDLGKPGLRVILPNPEYSTCGEMVFALLEKKGIRDAVLANVGNAMFRSHSDIGNKMKLGTADAAIMWNGVAHNYLDAIEIVPTPYEYDREIRVGVIGLKYSKNQPLVRQFLDFADQHGKAIFEEFGYVK